MYIIDIGHNLLKVYVDTVEELAAVPIRGMRQGSIAFIIDDKQEYTLNGKGKWINTTTITRNEALPSEIDGGSADLNGVDAVDGGDAEG